VQLPIEVAGRPLSADISAQSARRAIAMIRELGPENEQMEQPAVTPMGCEEVECGTLVTFTDYRGTVRSARRAPSVREIIDAHQALTQSDRAGERVEARVRYNGCTACCHYPRVEVDPARERPEDLPRTEADLQYRGQPRIPLFRVAGIPSHRFVHAA
jgi:hypothetical protein